MALKRSQREWSDLQKDYPFIQLTSTLLQSPPSCLAWRVKILLMGDDDDNTTLTISTKVLYLEVFIPSDYPFKGPKILIITREEFYSPLDADEPILIQRQYQKPEKKLIPYLSLLEEKEWNPRLTISSILRQLRHLLIRKAYPMISVVHSSLLSQQIPIELRSIVITYLCGQYLPIIEPPLPRLGVFTDGNIRYAVWLWQVHRDIAMFRYGDISRWDTSQVTQMNDLFAHAINFDENINDWDVSNVQSMRGMFIGAASFNQPLDRWDIQKVKDMQYMFHGAKKYNQSLASWVSKLSEDVNTQCMFDATVNETVLESVTGWGKTDTIAPDKSTVTDGWIEVTLKRIFIGGMSSHEIKITCHRSDPIYFLKLKESDYGERLGVIFWNGRSVEDSIPISTFCSEADTSLGLIIRSCLGWLGTDLERENDKLLRLILNYEYGSVL